MLYCISSSYNKKSILTMASTNASLFNFARFQSLLGTKEVGRCVVYRPSGCTSTMELAERECIELAANGTMVLAECQSAGRGREKGRRWLSSGKGSDLYVTFVMRRCAGSGFRELLKLNLASSVAMAKACQLDGKLSARTKWPNDVWIGCKKVAGMLVDSDSSADEIVARIGIGINVNRRHFECDDGDGGDPVSLTATSLALELGTDVEREVVLASYCNDLERLGALDFDRVLAEYTELDLLCAHERIVVMPKKRENAERRIAKAIGFSSQGFLIVRYEDDQSEQTLVAAEVSIRPFEDQYK
jgi:BirA family transcriptional regulator, biotin operon repressor / biotin---[acetyl-CoA-carboxylase] ligase